MAEVMAPALVTEVERRKPLIGTAAPRLGTFGLVATPGFRAALLLAPALFFVFYLHFFPSTDSDYWWHVRTGQYIFETGALPRGDIYSYTAEGRPWVTHEWLTELLFYVVQRQFGYVGNVVLFGLVSVLTWLAVYATCRRRGVGAPGATLLVLCGAAMATGSANVRPQMFTMLLLAVSALLLTRYRQGAVKSIWLLPPLFGLWVNLHGGYVIGLTLLGLTIVGEGLSRARRQPAARLSPLLLVTALSAAATLLNPHGVDALLYPFSYAGSGNASMRYIMEWQSPDFHLHEPYVLVFGASLLLALALGVGRGPLGTTEALWALLFALMALQSIRHIPLYAVVAMPLMGARLQARAPWLRHQLVGRWQPKVIVGFWLFVIAACLSLADRQPGDKTGPQLCREPSAASYPVGAIDYLRSHDAEGNLFNEYVWGGYLIHQLYPQRRVFIDGRADVYGDAFMDSYVAVQRLKPNWRQVLDEYDVRLVLVKKEAPLAVVLGGDAGWQEVYAGEVERLFARRGDAPAELRETRST